MVTVLRVIQKKGRLEIYMSVDGRYSVVALPLDMGFHVDTCDGRVTMSAIPDGTPMFSADELYIAWYGSGEEGFVRVTGDIDVLSPAPSTGRRGRISPGKVQEYISGLAPGSVFTHRDLPGYVGGDPNLRRVLNGQIAQASENGRCRMVYGATGNRPSVWVATDPGGNH